MKETTVKKKVTGHIVIDREVCKGCGYCIRACPKDCITMDDKFNCSGYYPAIFSNPAQCTGCAVCAVSCPDVAIDVWRDE
jgi:2-oxoglutarate ferredoxin oxidoreductase subunit delta